jgi:hypothetical protein
VSWGWGTSIYLVRSMLISRPTSSLSSNRVAVFFFLILNFSPNALTYQHTPTSAAFRSVLSVQNLFHINNITFWSEANSQCWKASPPGNYQTNIYSQELYRRFLPDILHLTTVFQRQRLYNIRHTHMRVYPKVSGLAAWRENCKWDSSLPLGAVVSLFYESV